MSELQINAALQIGKPPSTVFQSILDPAQMSNYFISKASAPLTQGAKVVWQFPEFDMDVPVRVERLEQDRLIVWHWGEGPGETRVEIALSPFEIDSTVVRITEGTKPNDEAGIKWLIGNTEGWANFLACLKAWLEHGINLRKGGFDFRGNKAAPTAEEVRKEERGHIL